MVVVFLLYCRPVYVDGVFGIDLDNSATEEKKNVLTLGVNFSSMRVNIGKFFFL